jgi:hypothetical protein
MANNEAAKAKPAISENYNRIDVSFGSVFGRVSCADIIHLPCWPNDSSLCGYGLALHRRMLGDRQCHA